MKNEQYCAVSVQFGSLSKVEQYRFIRDIMSDDSMSIADIETSVRYFVKKSSLPKIAKRRLLTHPYRPLKLKCVAFCLENNIRLELAKTISSNYALVSAGREKYG